MTYYEFTDPVASLLAFVADMEARVNGIKFKKQEDISGLKNDILRLKLNIQRFLRMKDTDKARTIGFFGAQKRGKSSLINILLGCKLMPVHSNVMSSITIKAKQDNEQPENRYTVDILFKNGHEEQSVLSLEETQNLLKIYGSRKGGGNSGSVSEIIVSGKFANSKILSNGGMLVDTPGAELAFGEVETSGEKEGEYKSEKYNKNEIDNALDTLGKTQIVVFVERTQYMESRNSVEFYRNELEKLSPITVLNFMDRWLDDHDEEPREKAIDQMKVKMFDVFGVKYDDVICVSSKDKVFDAKENENITILEENGINKLECVILERLNNLKLEKVITESVKEIKSLIIRLNKIASDFTINKLFLHNFLMALKNESPELYDECFNEINRDLGPVVLGLYCNSKLQIEFNKIA